MLKKYRVIRNGYYDGTHKELKVGSIVVLTDTQAKARIGKVEFIENVVVEKETPITEKEEIKVEKPKTKR